MVACANETPRAPSRPAPAVHATPVDSDVLPDVTAAVDPPAAPTAHAPVGAAFRLERAAAVSPARVFAVAGERLWRTENGAWRELPVGGGAVRDVTALHGTLWVLVRGVGANAGHLTVLRSAGDDALSIAWDVVTSPTHDPRALAMASDHEFYVGGANPTLLRGRVAGSLQTNVHSLPHTVVGLNYMPDQMMAVTYEDGAVAMFRWGEVNAVERAEYLFSFSGVRESLMVRRDGAVWRGRVWEQPIETDRLSSSSGMTPLAAVTLRDERVVEVDGERARMLRDGRWVELPSPERWGDVLGLYGARSLAEGLCVLVDRDGGVFELTETAWQRRVAAPSGAVR